MPKGGNGNGGNKPPKISNQTFANAENDRIIGVVQADVNPSKASWSIDPEDDIFVIDPQTGQLSVADGSSLDYESQQSHTLTVQVTENGKKVHSAEITVNVSDVNEAPSAGPDFTVSAAEMVDENAVLATVTGTDPDFLAYTDTDGVSKSSRFSQRPEM